MLTVIFLVIVFKEVLATFLLQIFSTLNIDRSEQTNEE